MKKIKYLTLGNRKLPKTTAIFNLPHGETCLGQTAYCAKHCYAAKAERMYKQVLPFRKRNLQLAKTADFTAKLNEEIQISGVDVVRVHESGDFFSQDYLDQWVVIAELNPAVTFYAYTKSFKLYFNHRPKNFIVRGSVDPSSSLKERKAALVLDGTAETFDTAPTIKDTFVCPGSCKSCNYCLQPGAVAFKKH